MEYFKQFITVCVFLVLFSLVFLERSYAYIDPGSSSYILQLIIGIFIGAAFTIRICWRKIKIFFGNLFLKKQKKDD